MDTLRTSTHTDARYLLVANDKTFTKHHHDVHERRTAAAYKRCLVSLVRVALVLRFALATHERLLQRNKQQTNKILFKHLQVLA